MEDVAAQPKRRRPKFSKYATALTLIVSQFTKLDLDPYTPHLRVLYALCQLAYCFVLNVLVRSKVDRAGALAKLAADKDERAWKEWRRMAGLGTDSKGMYFTQTLVAMKSPDWGEDEIETEMT